MTKSLFRSHSIDVSRQLPRPWQSHKNYWGLVITMGVILATLNVNTDAFARVQTGAASLATESFAPFKGLRIGLITNQTGTIGTRHLVDVMRDHDGINISAIFAPEHGFRGSVEAGETVRDGVDVTTGIPVVSLYGRTKKPTQKMLRDVDILIFDIQDIGVRFYTYISTMGLAMQAAAEANIPFVVLDRPNPLGGNYVSGFVLKPELTSFVGQFPIPIVHGLTVAELATMIKGERWLPGLANLDLRIAKMKGWTRDMRWLQTGLRWQPTSPNIPTFNSALVYSGIGIIGETQLVNEGRGTPEPFTKFGAPWLDARQMARRLNALGLPGARFTAESYRPRSIPKVAAAPVFVGQRINGITISITNPATYQPLEVGIQALALLVQEAQRRKVSPIFKKRRMFHLISGTTRLRKMLLSSATGSSIIASWQAEVRRFKETSHTYHLY